METDTYKFLTESVVINIDDRAYMVIHAPITHIYTALPNRDGEIVKWDYHADIPIEDLKIIADYMEKEWNVKLDIRR